MRRHQTGSPQGGNDIAVDSVIYVTIYPGAKPLLVQDASVAIGGTGYWYIPGLFQGVYIKCIVIDLP